MLQHDNAGDDTQNAGEQLPAPQRTVYEDADDLKEPLHQPPDAQELDQDEQGRAWRGQQEDSQNNESDALEQDHPPGNSFVFHTQSNSCHGSSLLFFCLVL